MTGSAPGDAVRQAGLDFARKLHDPEVRQRLKDVGFNGNAGHVIIAATPGEALQDVIARGPGEGARLLVVWSDGDHLTGWQMVWTDGSQAPA